MLIYLTMCIVKIYLSIYNFIIVKYFNYNMLIIHMNN